MNNQQRAYLFAILTILFWSTVATAFKIGLTHSGKIELVAFSTYTSFVILLIFVIAQKKWPVLKSYSTRQYFFSMIYGLINPFLYYFILFSAYSLLPAQIAQPVNMTWPIVLVILSSLVLRQKVSVRSYAALIISFAGVAVISFSGDFQKLQITNPKGVFLALLSAVVWSSYWILNLKDERDEEVKLLLNFFFASIFITIFCLIIGFNREITFKGIVSGIYIGTFEMGLGFIFWLKALRLSKSTDKVSNLIFVTPFISLIFIHLILGEQIYLTTFAGLFLIITGIVIQKMRRRKSDEEMV